MSLGPQPRASIDPGALTGLKPSKQVNVITVGPQSVGKTSLLLRFCERRAPPAQPTATLGVEFKYRDIDAGTERIRLTIWDTAGQENYRSMSQNYFRHAHGVVLVFDVTDSNSLIELEPFVEMMRNYCPVGYVSVLVGNKVDLPAKVTEEEGEMFRRRHGISLFFQTSAKEGTRVEECFLALCNHCILQMETTRSFQRERKCEHCDSKPAKYFCKVCSRSFCEECQKIPHDAWDRNNLHLNYVELSQLEQRAGVGLGTAPIQLDQPRYPAKKNKSRCICNN
jgi:small GTP-binding protein